MARFVSGAPGADRIEILQCETERVDLLVTIVAGFDSAMFGVKLANRQIASRIGFRNFDVIRRRTRRSVSPRKIIRRQRWRRYSC